MHFVKKNTIFSFPDPPSDGQVLPPGLLPLLRVQRVPGRRAVHRGRGQQDLLRQRLPPHVRAQVR